MLASQKSAWTIGILTALAAMVVALLFVKIPTDESTYLHFILGRNLHDGYGLVYGPGNDTLLTLTPIPALIAALSPGNAALSLLGISALSIMGIIILIGQFLGKQPEKSHSPYFILLGVIPAFASSLFSPQLFALAIVLLCVLYYDRSQYVFAGLLLSLAALTKTDTILILPLLILILGKWPDFRFWPALLILPTLWGIYAAVTYDSMLLIASTGSMQVHELPGLLLLGGSLIVARRSELPVTVKPLLLWSIISIVVGWVFSGEINHLSNPAMLILSFAVILHEKPRWQIAAPALLVCFVVLPFLFPLSRDAADAKEIAHALDLPPEASLLHDSGDAFTYYAGLNQVSRVDGNRSTLIHQLVENQDVESVLIAIWPDYVYFSDSALIGDDILSTFQAQEITENLYALRHTGSEEGFSQQADVEIIYRPDVKLIHVESDSARIAPGSIFRMGLTWQIDAQTENTSAVRIDLVRPDGVFGGSTQRQFPPEQWHPGDITNYFAIPVEEDTLPGVYDALVTVENRAGILGTHSADRVVLPFPAQDKTQAIDSLGMIDLVNVEPQLTDHQLELTTNWLVQQNFTTNYQVFAHLTSIDDQAPIIQADGPPVGGNYPSQYWKQGDFIIDERNFDLTNLSPGAYHINIGLYDENGQRITLDGKDFITVLTIDILENGDIEIQQN